MNRKKNRVVIAFILVLGLVICSVSMGYAAPSVRPIVSAEIINIYGGQNGEIEIQYSWQNAPANSSFYYKIEKSRSLITEYTTTASVSSYDSGSQHLLFSNLSAGTYKITAQLIKDSKTVAKNTDSYKYTGTVATTYSITFDETNSITGVNIQVYSDEGLTNTVGTLLSTNASGEAITDLANGTYYYKATKTGYQDYNTDNFTVADAGLTESFTMLPSVYTATFSEANDLAGVSVQVFSDASFTMPVGSVLTTNSSGDATTSLPNGDYYFKATLATYDDYYSDTPLPINNSDNTYGFQMMPVNHIWTFQEFNNLSGVAIQFYTDGTYTTPTSISGTTDSTGAAIIYDLPHGEYWWKATLDGYDAYTGSYTISGDTNSNFEMIPTYEGSQVTFKEAYWLSGVAIQLYYDQWDRIPVGDPLITNEYGEVLTHLPYDTENPKSNVYYFRAHKDGFDELGGTLTVPNNEITVNFEMKTTENALFAEDFSTATIGSLPSGWSTNSPSLINVYDTKSAWGNDKPELLIASTVDPENYVNIRVSTPAIDCTTATSLNLSFDQYISHMQDDYYTLSVQVSTDGGMNWVDVKTYQPAIANTNAYWEIGPETVNLDLSAFAGETINIAWYAEGYTYNMSGWTIDDIYLTGTDYYALHKVTFVETNSLAGVNISIFTDDDYSFYRSITTNESGVATIDLLNGAYWCEAVNVGYSDSGPYVPVSGKDVRCEFTMSDIGTDYPVTFAEETSLAGVDIMVYNIAECFTANLSTNSSGGATIDLPNGDYRFGANLPGFDTYVGNFTVYNSAPATLNFSMVPTSTVAMPYNEDFTGDSMDGFPSGWSTNYPSNWFIRSYNNAGGIAPELSFKWGYFNDAAMAITPPIDASTSSGLQLSFKENVVHYQGTYTLQVQVSTDGGITWDDPVWSINPTGNIGSQTVIVDLSAYDGQTINIAWVIDGISYNIDNWYIDDISLTESVI